MRFSVLMSVYCKENDKYFQDALESVVNQTYLPDEVVIVKDGKLTKELDAVVDKFTKKYKHLVKIIELENNVGLGNALNIGVNACKNNIIARMDTDDICRKDRFEKQIQIFKLNDDVDIVGSFIDEFDESMKNKIATKTVPINNEEILKFSKRRNPFNHMTVMYKKQSVLEAGNYIDFKWNEDYYLWTRMLNKGYKGFNIPESLVYARTGESMFERRGGYEYAKIDIKLQKELLNMKYTTLFQCVSNMLLRCSARLIPNNIRKKIYLKMLRNK